MLRLIVTNALEFKSFTLSLTQHIQEEAVSVLVSASCGSGSQKIRKPVLGILGVRCEHLINTSLSPLCSVSHEHIPNLKVCYLRLGCPFQATVKYSHCFFCPPCLPFSFIFFPVLLFAVTMRLVKSLFRGLSILAKCCGSTWRLCRGGSTPYVEIKGSS